MQQVPPRGQSELVESEAVAGFVPYKALLRQDLQDMGCTRSPTQVSGTEPPLGYLF
jgi:hypothetical protein